MRDGATIIGSYSVWKVAAFGRLCLHMLTRRHTCPIADGGGFAPAGAWV